MIVVGVLHGTFLESRAKRVAEEFDMVPQSDPSI
jgi:hypothetical protein